MGAASKIGEQASNLGHKVVENVEAGYEKLKEAVTSNKDEGKKKWARFSSLMDWLWSEGFLV